MLFSIGRFFTQFPEVHLIRKSEKQHRMECKLCCAAGRGKNKGT